MKNTLLVRLYLVLSLFININIYGKPLVYGHRGQRAVFPENTLTGYRQLLNTDVDFIDMDVALTKDKNIVVTHDLELLPRIVSDANGDFIDYSSDKREQYLIKNFLYKDLQKFNVGKINPMLPYADFFPQQKKLAFESIPKLSDLIDLVLNSKNKKIKFQIEMKTDPVNPDDTFSPQEFAQLLYKLLKEKNVIDKSEIQAFDWSCLYALQNLDPQIKTAYLTSRDSLADFTVADKKLRTLWTGGKDLLDYKKCIPCMVKQLGGSLWDPEDYELSKKNLDLAHKLGLKVVVWNWPEKSKSYFDEGMIKKLVAWGVDGIISDDPVRLSAFLKNVAGP